MKNRLFEKFEQAEKPIKLEKFPKKRDGERRGVKHQQRGDIHRRKEHERMPDKLGVSGGAAAFRVAVKQFDGKGGNTGEKRGKQKRRGGGAFADDEEAKQNQQKERGFDAVKQAEETERRRTRHFRAAEDGAGGRHGEERQQRQRKFERDDAFNGGSH